MIWPFQLFTSYQETRYVGATFEQSSRPTIYDAWGFFSY